MTKNVKNILISWILPLPIAGTIFMLARPVFAENLRQQTKFSEYLNSEGVLVGTDTIGGYAQVYYKFQDTKNYITEGSDNNQHAFSQGEFIVWDRVVRGASQIFRYHIPTKQLIQLTSSSTNIKPQVNRYGQVVWERWVAGTSDKKDGWQVYYFDGTEVSQITKGDISVNPVISEESIKYLRKSPSGEWRALSYSLINQKVQQTEEGILAKLSYDTKGSQSTTGKVSPPGGENANGNNSPFIQLDERGGVAGISVLDSEATKSPSPNTVFEGEVIDNSDPSSSPSNTLGADSAKSPKSTMSISELLLLGKKLQAETGNVIKSNEVETNNVQKDDDAINIRDFFNLRTTNEERIRDELMRSMNIETE